MSYDWIQRYEIHDMYRKYLIVYRSDKLEQNKSFVDEYFSVMKNEVNRFLTFENGWDRCLIPASRMAFAGFFYLFLDRVQCAFCKNILFNWTKNQDPVETHKKHFPFCPLVIGDDVENKQINPDEKLYN